jgi:outer membrane protein assembly factor BamB
MPHEVLGSPALEPDGDSPGLFLGSKFGDLIAIDAQTGRKRWHRMTGNWVDNNACVARVGDENVVFAGSYDRSVYALRASDGSVLWRRRLGAEVFSAPCVFEVDGRQRVAVACLDNHLVALDAATGEIRTCYYVGEPQWDRISKGDTLWGSPVALQVGKTAMLIHGSYDGAVYMVPARQSALEVTPWRAERLVWGMVIVLVLFAGVALPVLRRLDRGQGGRLP